MFRALVSDVCFGCMFRMPLSDVCFECLFRESVSGFCFGHVFRKNQTVINQKSQLQKVIFKISKFRKAYGGFSVVLLPGFVELRKMAPKTKKTQNSGSKTQKNTVRRRFSRLRRW